MRSYDQTCNGSNLIGIISYLSKVDLSLIIHYSTYLTFLFNLPNQLFDQPTKSTFSINQPTINVAAPLACGTSLFLTNLCT